MLRREFFGVAATPFIAVPDARAESVAAIVARIEAMIRREMPHLNYVQVKYDPADKKVPLMILALHV
jgi:divalent metal cation (Fe/Co/Zn/Cd) transporter